MPPVEEGGPQVHGGKVREWGWEVGAEERGEEGQEGREEGERGIGQAPYTQPEGESWQENQVN